jgi:hypothetical protein
MNKKYLIYTLLVGFLTMSSISFSMRNMPKIIYYGSKIVASTAIPVFIAKSLYEDEKKTEEEIAAMPDVKSKDPIIQEWAEGIIQELGCSQYDISLKYGEGWAACSNKNKNYIRLPFEKSFLLESALREQRNANHWQKMTFFEKFKEKLFGLFEENELIEAQYCDQYIDRSSTSLKHELGHIVAHDCQNATLIKLAIPIAVETVCAGVTYNFNKLCKISPPKTIIKSLGRSALAGAGLLPKVTSSLFIYQAHARHRETQADKFACENAATKKELEARYFDLKSHGSQFEQHCRSKLEGQRELTEKELRSEYAKFDSLHPYPADRTEMVQEYIGRWDAKHPEDKH